MVFDDGSKELPNIIDISNNISNRNSASVVHPKSEAYMKNQTNNNFINYEDDKFEKTKNNFLEDMNETPAYKNRISNMKQNLKYFPYLKPLENVILNQTDIRYK